MESHDLTDENISVYAQWLHQEERSNATREKYMRSVRKFSEWLNGEPITKEGVTRWKEVLLEQNYAP